MSFLSPIPAMRLALLPGLRAGFLFLFVLAPFARGDVRELYLAQCATCHGETGDGKGVTQLDRPARSFLQGGFSYGNTPEALYRTITGGIPGTPMPGFDPALTEEQRRQLADYVISLGPPLPKVDPKASILAVTDKPRVVRGHLPPMADGLPERPRGLLVGMPSGLTFEWRIDDVRLLGLRMGEFVDRRDWTGRGGTPIQPLGKVVQLIGKGDPGPTWQVESGRQELADGSNRILTENLRGVLAGTWVQGGRAGVDYRLVDADGKVHAKVRDEADVLGTSVGSGFRRRLALRSQSGDSQILGRLLDFEGEPEARFTNAEAGVEWQVHKNPGGSFACTGMHVASKDVPALYAAGPVLMAKLEPEKTLEVLLFHVTTQSWDDTTQNALMNEVKP